MKNLLTLLIITLTLAANAQSFGSDVVVDNTGNRRKMETVVAANGWIYAAAYAMDGAGAFHQFVLSRSTDGGANWVSLISSETFDVDVVDFDFLVTGSTTADLRIHIANAYHNLVTGEYALIVSRYDGNTGAFIDYPHTSTTGTDPIRSVSIAADNNVPSTSSTATSIAIAFSFSEAAQDQIVVRQSDDGGITYPIQAQAAATSQFIREIDLDYGRGATSTFAQFHLVYEALPSIGTANGNIYYTYLGPAFGGTAWQTAVNLTADASVAGLCRNPRIAVQRSISDNSSGSHTVVVLAEYDPSGTNASSHVLGFISPTPTSWFPIPPSVNTNYCYNADIEYDHQNERFVLAYFDFTAGSIEVAGLPRNISPSDVWMPIASNVNDLGLNTVAPRTRILYVPVQNKIGVCWIEESAIGLGEIHYDQQGTSSGATVETNSLMNFEVYPNPVKDALHIVFEKGTESSSVSIFGLNGQRIRSSVHISNGMNSINVEDLPSGMYLLQFESLEGLFNQYFIKE